MLFKEGKGRKEERKKQCRKRREEAKKEEGKGIRKKGTKGRKKDRGKEGKMGGLDVLVCITVKSLYLFVPVVTRGSASVKLLTGRLRL